MNKTELKSAMLNRIQPAPLNRQAQGSENNWGLPIVPTTPDKAGSQRLRARDTDKVKMLCQACRCPPIRTPDLNIYPSAFPSISLAAYPAPVLEGTEGASSREGRQSSVACHGRKRRCCRTPRGLGTCVCSSVPSLILIIMKARCGEQIK